jgi:hypothetical protein
LRKLRRLLRIAVPGMGMALVLGAVLLADSLGTQLFLVVAGLLMTEAGFWRWAEPLLPDERRFMPLRRETDHFVTLVRQLNGLVLSLAESDEPGPRFALDEMELEMHRSVDRMIALAGQVGPRRGERIDAAPPSGSDVAP